MFFSRQYLNNIGSVDSGVAEMVSIIEDFFDHDGRTAYVFTSDHGMTNWGGIILPIDASQMPPINGYSLPRITFRMSFQVHTAQATPRRLSLLWWCGELESKLLTEPLIPKHTLTGTYKVLNSHIS